jgi:hypothetical protein
MDDEDLRSTKILDHQSLKSSYFLFFLSKDLTAHLCCYFYLPLIYFGN